MVHPDKKIPRRLRRHGRVRRKVSGTGDRPRVCIFRSLRQIYAQVIDDRAGRTLAAASSLDPELRGEALAGKAAAHGITEVVFDRGGYKYHGRVKALAEGARKGGLRF